MNELFVNVKVDREERPDIDQIYQARPADAHAAHRRLAAHDVPHARPGAVLRRDLLPEGAALRPAGLRRPHAARARLLRREARRHRGAERRAGRRARAHAAARRRAPVRVLRRAAARGDRLPREHLRPRARRLRPGAQVPAPGHDRDLPAPLRRARGDATSLAMATTTLAKMAEGGIFDQLGGGFARYSVDDDVGHPALREDALRQRPAPAPLRRRVGGHGRAALRAHRRGDGRLGDARDAVARRRLLLLARRRFRGRGGQVLRLDARGGARAAHARGAGGRHPALRLRPRPQLRGPRLEPGRRDAARRRRRLARHRARPTRARAWLGARAKLLAARERRIRPGATTRSSPRGTRS